MSQSIEVVSVNVSRETGTVKQPVPEAVVGSLGIQGDAHAGPWQRQVSLLSMESIGRQAREIGRDIRAGEFGENLTVRGMYPDCLALLDRLRFAEVELEITQIGKQCHGEGCGIFQQVGKCVMPVEGVFARVLHGGIVRPGDRGEHTAKRFRFLVITVSDRAAAGQYADRSGPKIKELIESFVAGKPRPAEIEVVLISDDPEQLRTHLLAAKDRGIDVVFTTGGTGIGPRDTTPETVAASAIESFPESWSMCA